MGHIKLLLLDVDGVLTDGSIIYDDNNVEIKRFNVKDGLGLRLLQDAGIRVGIITGRASQVVRHRCRNLGITLIYDGIKNKKQALTEIMAETGIHADEIAFVGDDLPDLVLSGKVGLFIAVSDAAEEVKTVAGHVTSLPGGKGAVREVCEALLKAQGHWDGLCEQFRR